MCAMLDQAHNSFELLIITEREKVSIYIHMKKKNNSIEVLEENIHRSDIGDLF